MNDMKINFTQEEGKLIVSVSGDIDAYHSGDFKKSIREELESVDAHTVVLDMSNVAYIDSAGLGSLVALLKDVRTKGKEFVLASLKPNVKRIFEMTRLDRVFKIVDTLEEV